MTGRRRVPTALAKLHGRPGKRPFNELEPMPALEIGEAPDWLEDDAKEAWHHAVENAPPGMLTALDQGMLTVWCIAESLLRRAYENLMARGGRLVRRSQDNPAGTRAAELDIIREQSRTMMRAAMELGFTPTARPKIKIMKNLAGNPNDMAESPESTGQSLAAYIGSNPDVIRH